MAGVSMNGNSKNNSAGNNNQQDKGVKFHEGWLEHKGHDGKWVRYWCVLKNNVFYFFRKPDLTLTGTLTLDHKSKVEYKGGDAKSGFKFDLYTPKRLSYFKTPKSCERELWKAYIEGLTKGRVADTIDLLPGQIRDIQEQLGRYFKSKLTAGNANFPESDHTPGTSPWDSDPGSANSFDSPHCSQSGSHPVNVPQDYLVPVPPPQHPQQPPGPVRISQTHSAHDELGVVFYSGATNQGRPSWYFPNCNRQQAEDVLCVGAKFGNTLMRSRPDSGVDLVISKKNSAAAGTPFSHFIVLVDSNGYRLNVENPHEPMGSLTEVMEFFVETSGPTSTRPMTCNDLARLGLIDSNPYSTSIVTVPGGLEDAKFFPPPPSLQDLAALDCQAPPPPIPIAIGTNLPPAPQIPVTPHLRPTGAQKNGTTNQQNRDSAGRMLHDRSKSVPNISDEILSHVQTFREHQLKKVNQTIARERPPIKKSISEDHFRVPPLPPNHPTAGKAELHAITQAIGIGRNKKLSEPATPEASDTTTSSWAEKNNTPPASGRQKDPNQQDASIAQAPEHHLIKPSTVTPAKALVPKNDSHRVSQPDDALDELAAVTAKVAKQPLIVKKGPEVAPKPSSVGVVSKVITELSSTPAETASLRSTQFNAPTNNFTSESFKKKLDNLMVGPGTQAGSGTAVPAESNSTMTQSHGASTASNLYEDLEHYQNAKEILVNTTRNL